MDINNNQQTNTFIKGMDTDTSDMYIGEGSYRYAENLRVVTDTDNNSGELHIIQGTDKITLSPAISGKLLGFTSIRDYAVAIVKNSNKWSIYRIDVNAGEGQDNVTTIAGPFEEQIWPDDRDGETKPLSLVTRWEADDNIKLYIATGETKLLSINIAKTDDGRYENLGDDFDEIFSMAQTTLPPITANVCAYTGANIPGVILQYAYIVYNVNGQSTTLSTLSNVVVETMDKTHGLEKDASGKNVVELTLPQQVLSQYTKVFRVAYSAAGQLPRVDVIYNQKCQSRIIKDSGQSLENIATAEFIATNKLLFVPKEIESKGDYLFAANIKYTQDEIDKLFENFDARCYSHGSYYVENDTIINIGNKADAEDQEQADLFLESLDKNTDIYNHLFDAGSGIRFIYDNWQSHLLQTGSPREYVNGHGLCFDWVYDYEEDPLYFESQYHDRNSSLVDLYISDTNRTYARNEVYRFGVRLYDSLGNSSSVKWIADIKMPDYFVPYTNGSAEYSDVTIKNYVYLSNIRDTARREKYITVRPVRIKFIPRNTDKPYWDGIAKYEIVLAKRGIGDSYKIALGIIGYPTQISNDELCLPYFLTTDRFRIRRGLIQSITNFNPTWFRGNNGDLANAFVALKDFDQYKNAVIFASPEYTYQPDDIKSLLQQYYLSGITISPIAKFKRDAYLTSNQILLGSSYAPNFALSYGASYSSDLSEYSTDTHPVKTLQYMSAHALNLSTSLNTPGTDLQIGVEDDGRYYLTSLIIANVNQNSVAEYTPKGGTGSNGNAKKMAYFTNMYCLAPVEDIHYNDSNYDRTIRNVVYVDSQDPEGFAKNEWPMYRNKFAVVVGPLGSNAKKFFNWTNPAIIDTSVYDVFTGGDSTTTESWHNTTMTSMNDDSISRKHSSIMEGEFYDYEYDHEVIGTLGLSFPTSSGGSSIILESDTAFSFGADSSNDAMPSVIVTNIYKSAQPYGGDTNSARMSTLYLSFGLMSDKENSIVANMGDNYISMFSYMPYHNFDNAQHDTITTAGLQYIVPVESTIDLSKQCSNYILATNSSALPVRGDGTWVQVHPSTVAGRFTQTTDMYMYNTAYSVLPDVVTYSAEDTVNATSSLYDSRIHYSQKKQNNELIDNWTNFKAVDFLDVDSRYGQITGLKLFKDKLIFLQENGAGVLSVNDRILLNDQTSANIIVGNGGVLDRYDYFTTIYGMKPGQHAIDASNDALYWWDGHRKEIISYVDGYNVGLLQRIKNVQNYVNKYEESDTPSIICDTDNKEVLFNVVNNKALVYNELILQFTSVYTFSPIYYCNINGKMFITDTWANGYNLHEYNKTSANGVVLFETPLFQELEPDTPIQDGEGPQYIEQLDDSSHLYAGKATPKLTFVVNKDAIYNKVFDIQTFGGRFYNGNVNDLSFNYKTPLKLQSSTTGSSVTNREYDYRLAVPRNNNDVYGGRMRGKTMECELTSSSNNIDFSIQYVTTKYRMSWS